MSLRLGGSVCSSGKWATSNARPLGGFAEIKREAQCPAQKSPDKLCSRGALSQVLPRPSQGGRENLGQTGSACHPTPLYQLAQHLIQGQEPALSHPPRGRGDEGGAVLFPQRTWRAGATWSTAGTAGGWRSCPETVGWNSSTTRASRSSSPPPSSKEKGVGGKGEKGEGGKGEKGPPLLLTHFPQVVSQSAGH